MIKTVDSEAGAELQSIRSLLENLFQRYGFDFRDYAEASIRRRIANVLRTEGLISIAALNNKLHEDTACVERFLLALSINTTSMFRDPHFYVAFRQRVVPLLRTYPFIRIWHVGCSTGEEVYSSAIVLKEEGLYPRCRIYATDMNEAVLAKARAGVYSLSSIRDFTRNYIAAGGSGSFSDYYVARYDHALLHPALRQNVVFAQHNLVADQSFNEFQLIFCRNVMIYFNYELQNRVHGLLRNSMCPFGFLILGLKESLRFTSYESEYDEFDPYNKIYRRSKASCTKS